MEDHETAKAEVGVGVGVGVGIETKIDNTQSGSAAGIGLLLAIVLIGWILWTPLQLIVGHDISFFDNDLEKATILDKSTRSDFDKFRDNGGLDNKSSSTWKNFGVNHISVSYNSNDKIDSVNLLINKNGYQTKLGSAENLKSSLSSICSSNWLYDGNQYSSINGNTMCRILPSNNNIMDVMFLRKSN